MLSLLYILLGQNVQLALICLSLAFLVIFLHCENNVFLQGSGLAKYFAEFLFSTGTKRHSCAIDALYKWHLKWTI